MLKTYEIELPQGDIEFLTDVLHKELRNWEHDALMTTEIQQLRTKLNETLTCDVTECENKRSGLDEQCASCEDFRQEMKSLYANSSGRYSREEIMDVYHDDEHKRAVMLHELGYE